METQTVVRSNGEIQVFSVPMECVVACMESVGFREVSHDSDEDSSLLWDGRNLVTVFSETVAP